MEVTMGVHCVNFIVSIGPIHCSSVRFVDVHCLWMSNGYPLCSMDGGRPLYPMNANCVHCPMGVQWTSIVSTICSLCTMGVQCVQCVQWTSTVSNWRPLCPMDVHWVQWTPTVSIGCQLCPLDAHFVSTRCSFCTDAMFIVSTRCPLCPMDAHCVH